MKALSARADVGKISYLLGEELYLRLVFDVPPADLVQVTNVSVDLLRLEQIRNEFAFGFGTKPTHVNNTLELRQTVPSTLRPGPHMVTAATLSWELGDGATHQQRVTFPPLVFALQTVLERPLTKPDLERMIGSLENERAAYVHREVVTAAASGMDAPRAFIVWIFGVGSLLHSHQQLEGYSIRPLRHGFSHRHLHEIVNTTLKELDIDKIPFDESIEQDFARGTPTFLVTYENVRAKDETDALDTCRSQAALLFDLLGLDRGQKPKEFFCMAAEIGTTQRWHLYQAPWYRGNLVPAFNPGATAHLIERLAPKVLAQPFLRLLLRTFSDATAEGDPGFALLRYWSVLELLADRQVPRGNGISKPDGSPILTSAGRPKTTDAKEARVYQYILNSGGYESVMTINVDGANKQYLVGGDDRHPAYTPETEIITLWDLVRAGYAIRNAIAHEGQFDGNHPSPGDEGQELAARLITNGHVDPRSFIRDIAEAAVNRELNRT